MEFYKVGTNFYVTIAFNYYLEEYDIRTCGAPPSVNMNVVEQALQVWREAEAEKWLIARGRKWGARQKERLAKQLIHRWTKYNEPAPYYRFVGQVFPKEEKVIELDPMDPEFKNLFLAGCVNPDSELI